MSKIKNFTFLIAFIITMMFSINTVKAVELNGVINDITVEKTNGSSGNFGQYEQTTVKVFWSITAPVHENDTFSFKMSNKLYLPTNMTFDLLDEDDNVMGVVDYNAATRTATVTFNNAADGMMDFSGEITFNTRLTVKLSEVERTEDINFEYDGNVTTVPIIVDPSPTIPEQEKLYKWGIINNTKTTIDFSIRVNYQKENIKNAIVSDTVGIGHEIDFSSFKVYKIYLDSVGGIISPQVLVDPSEYNVVEKNAHEFDLELGDISDTYRIDYKTNITDPDLQSYANTAWLKGENITTQEVSITAITSDGSGTGSGNLGKIKIIKQDADDNIITLANASFTLYDSNDNVVSEFTTNEEGVANIINLKFGTYKIVETSAPDGYKLDNSPLTVNIIDTTLKTYTIQNKLNTGNIKLIKLDEANNFLPGATFGIWTSDKDPSSDPALKTAVSTSTGEVTFSDLAIGDYKIKEVSAPDGYALNPTIYEKTVTSSTLNVNIGNVINKLITGKITLIKVDADNNFLAGATFGIWNNDKDPNTDAPITTKTTTSTGIITFTDLLPGTYKIKEITPPPGFKLVETIYTSTVSTTTLDQDLGEVVNDLIVGKVTLTKVGEQTSIKLSGATFSIWANDKDPNSNQALQTKTSDGTGIIEFNNLIPGTYKVKEISAPNGYILDETIHDITIATDGTTYNMGNISNTLIKGAVTFKKVDENNDGLAGAVFGIWAKDSDLENDDALAQATSTTSGSVTFTNLIPGDYIIKEISAPNGYQKLTDEFPITVTENNLAVILSDIQNKLIVGSVTLTKVDGNGNKLNGATFGIWRADQNPDKDNPLKEVKSNPEVKFTNLIPGTYIVKEISAPNGYNLDNTKHKITITLNNLNINLGSIKNEKIPATVPEDKSTISDTPVTGIDVSNILMLIISGFGLLIYYIFKRNTYISLRKE